MYITTFFIRPDHRQTQAFDFVNINKVKQLPNGMP